MRISVDTTTALSLFCVPCQYFDGCYLDAVEHAAHHSKHREMQISFNGLGPKP